MSRAVTEGGGVSNWVFVKVWFQSRTVLLEIFCLASELVYLVYLAHLLIHHSRESRVRSNGNHVLFKCWFFPTFSPQYLCHLLNVTPKWNTPQQLMKYTGLQISFVAEDAKGAFSRSFFMLLLISRLHILLCFEEICFVRYVK